MTPTSHSVEQLLNILKRPSNGIVGLVDDVLRLCHDQRLTVDWQSSQCRVVSLEDGSAEVFENPVRKSVFRAILARLAALCNEQYPHSLSPYGGQAELIIGSDSAMHFRLTFVNTADDQRLELIPSNHQTTT